MSDKQNDEAWAVERKAMEREMEELRRERSKARKLLDSIEATERHLNRLRKLLDSVKKGEPEGKDDET